LARHWELSKKKKALFGQLSFFTSGSRDRAAPTQSFLRKIMILERIVRKLFPCATLLRAWPLSGGISTRMVALEIELPTGETRKIILRQPGVAGQNHDPRAAEEEYKVLHIARSLGLPAPAPLVYDPSGKITPAPYLIIEYIEGRPDFAPANLGSYTRQAAEQLSHIHRAIISSQDLSFLPPYPKGLAETVAESNAALNRSMDEARIRAALANSWPFPRIISPALLHGDYWPGNLLWQEDRLAAVIDWEDAALGDPLADLAIARLDLLWIFGREAMQSFTDHYLSYNPIDSSFLPGWDLLAALRLIRMAGSNLAEWAAFFHPFGRADISEETILEQYRFFIEQAFNRMPA
jgi:aminoglycoside phosphotransferase (APT) family kinase protein